MGADPYSRRLRPKAGRQLEDVKGRVSIMRKVDQDVMREALMYHDFFMSGARRDLISGHLPCVAAFVVRYGPRLMQRPFNLGVGVNCQWFSVLSIGPLELYLQALMP
jgi:hypothetical protein